MASQEGDPGYTFLGKLGQSRNLATVLQALKLGQKSQLVHLQMSSHGITFTVEEHRQLQAYCTFRREQFTEFRVEEDSALNAFSVDYGHLQQAINIFQDDHGASVQDTINVVRCEEGGPLYIMVFQEGICSDWGLLTIASKPLYDQLADEIDQNNSNIMIKMDSKVLKQSIEELDWSADEIDIYVAPTSPHLRLSATSSNGSCQIDFNSDSPCLYHFICHSPKLFTYKLKAFKGILQGLQYSQAVILKFSNSGIFHLSIIIIHNDKSESIVHYFLMPQDAPTA